MSVYTTIQRRNQGYFVNCKHSNKCLDMIYSILDYHQMRLLCSSSSSLVVNVATTTTDLLCQFGRRTSWSSSVGSIRCKEWSILHFINIHLVQMVIVFFSLLCSWSILFNRFINNIPHHYCCGNFCGICLFAETLLFQSQRNAKVWKEDSLDTRMCVCVYMCRS